MTSLNLNEQGVLLYVGDDPAPQKVDFIRMTKEEHKYHMTPDPELTPWDTRENFVLHTSFDPHVAQRMFCATKQNEHVFRFFGEYERRILGLSIPVAAEYLVPDGQITNFDVISDTLTVEFENYEVKLEKVTVRRWLKALVELIRGKVHACVGFFSQ